MTLKNFCKIQINDKNKIKPRRRSGLLSPFALNPGKCKIHFEGTNVKSKIDENVIYQALINNEFLRNVLTGSSLQKLIDCMYEKNIEAGDTLLEQGHINSFLFVSKSGTYKVTENDKQTDLFGGSRVFGEVAILHSAKASQTIKAITKGSIWVLDCIQYKNITVNSHVEKREEIVSFLKDVPSIRRASNSRLYTLCDLFHEKFFPGTSSLVKEGDIVSDFIIVTSGTATILTRERNRKLDKLTRGCFFGDYIFQKETISLYTILADPPGVECLVISRKEFLNHFHDLEHFLNRKSSISPTEASTKYAQLQLKNLKKIKTLGLGGFGKVELVQDSRHKDDIFALKLMKKFEITGHQAHIDQVYNEKNLQMACNSDFIVRLFRTFRDNKYVYFLLEPCMGGDLWNMLRRQRRKCFDTDTAKFYAGCIVEALGYLHSRDIVYRDLKPENVMVSASGYLKLTDFGFAKKIALNETAYSFVGTAEYVAPELIQNLPHDRGVDYWALGVFIYELLVGNSPFRNEEHNDLKTYKAILKGIDFVTFPFIVSPRARNLIKKLCKPLSIDRIGCQKNGIKDIKIHPWFSKLDWEKLSRMELEPPIRISLNGRTDTRYFEQFREEKEDVVLEDFSAWDKDF
ncbi:cGMP-dependent protein kinase 1-like [Anthonomus grandis grandis]|uniref:cGMP-dependent protein kinase 1-like n=1 Tax=Anthonomus grandis grandis TaxID=2921223 RepID=UPI0021658339|nr:cGMP-dependent protein kinase 1-like [Anthonomus grandis grandis]XP_050295054.1 cGMP-dependent protein kinase 1-like [Anthonomus grandis grandis]XP_050295055.1 cGMP-dependent protein kinase 1-like [Anthonomus grandis grandis]